MLVNLLCAVIETQINTIIVHYEGKLTNGQILKIIWILIFEVHDLPCNTAKIGRCGNFPFFSIYVYQILSKYFKGYKINGLIKFPFKIHARKITLKGWKGEQPFS